MQLPQIFVKELPLNAGSATSVYLIADPAKLFNFAQRTFQIGEVAPVLKKILQLFLVLNQIQKSKTPICENSWVHIVHFYSIQPDCQNFKINLKAFADFLTKSRPQTFPIKKSLNLVHISHIVGGSNYQKMDTQAPL